MSKDVQKSLDTLFGNPENLQEGFEELKKMCEGEPEPISSHNTKQVIEDSEISNKNSKELVDIKAIEDVEEKKEQQAENLISDTNSDRALPDELASNNGVPISGASTEGIHDADSTTNEDLISTQNSDNALPNELSVQEDVPISITNANQMHENKLKEFEPISTHNSSTFVGDL